MKLIVGLGNPGLRYKNTRHNAGYMVCQALAKKYRIRLGRRLFKGLTGTGNIKGESVLMLLPETYMNLSGESVKGAMGKISGIDDLIVIYDDIDLPLGNVRFRGNGSSGGHKGLKSIQDRLGTTDIQRLRVGIRSETRIRDTSDFVLRPFLKEERKALKTVLEKAVNGIETWISSGIEVCMNMFN